MKPPKFLSSETYSRWVSVLFYYGAIIFFCAIGFGRFAYGESGGSMIPSLPSALIFPTPTGILFPAFNSAGGVNAAALPLVGKKSSFQGSYTSPGSGVHVPFGSIATASKKLGFNAGYLGVLTEPYKAHGGFAGAGFNIEPVSMGVGLREFDVQAGADPGVDIGLIVGSGKGLNFGFVMYNVNGGTQLNAGIGFGGGKKYNMEFNLLLPPFSSSSSGHYALTAQGNINAGSIFGFHFRTTYYAGLKTYEHTVGVAVWLKDSWNLFGQFTTPSVWTGGMTLTF